MIFTVFVSKCVGCVRCVRVVLRRAKKLVQAQTAGQLRLHMRGNAKEAVKCEYAGLISRIPVKCNAGDRSGQTTAGMHATQQPTRCSHRPYWRKRVPAAPMVTFAGPDPNQAAAAPLRPPPSS